MLIVSSTEGLPGRVEDHRRIFWLLLAHPNGGKKREAELLLKFCMRQFPSRGFLLCTVSVGPCEGGDVTTSRKLDTSPAMSRHKG
jgi:hypothetical protein